MEKRLIALIAIGIVLVSLSFVSAAVEVSVKPISDSYIIELNEPATFDLVIKNLGNNDYFEIYSLVGIDISPEEKINILSGETKTVRVQVVPQEALRSKRGFLTFEYLIKDSKNEIDKERLSINIASLSDAITITPDNLYPNSDSLRIVFKNTLMRDFSDLNIKMSSAFFNYDKALPLKGLEMKEEQISIDQGKLKTMTAGKYLISALIQTSGKTAEKEITFKFLEQENIDTSQSDEGWLLRRTEITKSNIGNVKKTIEITVARDLISNIFTSINTQPTRSEIKGFEKYYIWESELAPNEQLKVVVTTNWLYPIIVVLLIIGLILLILRYLKHDVTVKKNVYFVKTKGGEFALKVHLKVRGRRYAERIKIIDRIPPLTTLYEKFGAVTPDKVDLANKRLEWNLEALNKGEERIFSYIIYSKIGVVGKFELPPAKVIYEKDGQVKDNVSNRAFFVNEPGKHKYE
ncbi:Uncharacterised protein [uncultured archaeon]|nr:Uncharacterised protein [uncultured archaeon]